MQPRVYYTSKNPARNFVKSVRNLGWLIHNARYVSELCLSRYKYHAELSADGVRRGVAFTYVCDFASFDVAKQWIKRPSLAHAKQTILE